MVTEALAAFGTLLKRGNGASPTEVFTSIAEVLDIGGISLENMMADVTSQLAPGGYEESVPTTKKAGPIAFKLNFVPTNTTQSYATGLIKDYDDQTLRHFQVVFPDTGSTTWAFSAYVSKVDIAAPVKGILSGDVILTISGAPTLV
jgi:hypothetical protein